LMGRLIQISMWKFWKRHWCKLWSSMASK
jgi:hypothetical protein